jgi:hypothetical protein
VLAAITQARALQRNRGSLSRSSLGAALAYSAGAEADTVMMIKAQIGDAKAKLE